MNLDKELESLNEMIIKMADVVRNNLFEAFEVYRNYETKKHYEINDDIVDKFERLIEEMCLNIMVRERPYASDLRKVSGILKLVSDLERLGDHAEDIFEFSMKLKNIEKHNIQKITKIIEITLDMVNNSIISYVKQDINLASKVIKQDDEVDNMYDEIVEDLIKALKENKVSAEFGIYTTLVVKYIERIADHAVNVAEWVVYIINGFHKDKQIM